MKVIKRNKKITDFNLRKIENAILAAMKNGSGIIHETLACEVAKEIENEVHLEYKAVNEVNITTIEDMVFEKLIEKEQVLTAKAYEGYRRVREFQRSTNTIDGSIYGIVTGHNKEAMEENSNKNGYILATQRDLIAGEFSKDYCRRTMLPPNIVQAHDNGILHFHDMDYFVQQMINCDLVNLKDIFAHGTVINKKMIETPKSLQTACTVTTQIVQQIANGQYGGQTISIAHLAPFVRISYQRHKQNVEKEGKMIGYTYTKADITKIAARRLKDEIVAGIQTIQYQINTFSTTNGQAPFLSVFMYINEEPGYEKETAMLIEEMLNQRYVGMKNEAGVYVTPAFPKLLYVLDENNVGADSEYRYLTDLAVKCVAKRMMPDFISAKIMKENYHGEVFPCMGCRSFLSPWKDKNGKYKWYGRFNQGVVTLNLADVGLSAQKDINRFWQILDERLKLCFEALLLRHESLKGALSDISPVHWQHGGLARLESGETIDELLNNGYATISLGYIGLYECTLAMVDESHTSEKGEDFAIRVMERLRAACDEWKAKTRLAFGLYGTPAESTTYTLAKALKEKFGIIEGITDRDYLTNSYHVNVCEDIDAFDKLECEAKFQQISSGGAISYVEVTNLNDNLEALSQVVEYMYETIQYAEINTKSDYCHQCQFDGEILVDENHEWYCPQCGNQDKNFMTVCRRTCGYLGDNFWNKGRTQEITDRVIHLDNKVYKERDELQQPFISGIELVSLDDVSSEDSDEDTDEYTQDLNHHNEITFIEKVEDTINYVNHHEEVPVESLVEEALGEVAQELEEESAYEMSQDNMAEILQMPITPQWQAMSQEEVYTGQEVHSPIQDNWGYQSPHMTLNELWGEEPIVAHEQEYTQEEVKIEEKKSTFKSVEEELKSFTNRVQNLKLGSLRNLLHDEESEH